MKICVLNASNPGPTLHLESDVYVDYRQGRRSCFSGQERVKQCTSWHAWTYALETEFFVYNKDKWQGCFQYDAIILLVNRDMTQILPLIKKLKLMKKKVAISFHEGVQDLITSSGLPNEPPPYERWIGLYELVKECDFYINIFGQLGSFFEGWFGRDKVKFCHHTAPIDQEFEKTVWTDKPYDVLIGTRTFNQRLSRNTFITIGALNGWSQKTGRSVHYLSEDGNVEPLFKRLGLNNIKVHIGPLKWNDWIKFLDQHKTLIHQDQSSNLGQVCLDCAITRTIPIGSTTYNNMLIGTDDGGSIDKAIEILDEVFENYSTMMIEMKKFREIIHPDKVKQDLMRLFE